MEDPRERLTVGAWFQRHWRQIAALSSSVLITALVLLNAERLTGLQGYGYAGVFIVSLLGNATVILPVPSLAIVFAGGSVLHPLMVGLVAGVAEPLGELTGYMAGYGGSAIIEDRKAYQRLQEQVAKHRFWTIAGLSAIPNPVFDLAGIAAGAMKMGVGKFLVACWLGKTFKAILIAYLGSLSIDWLSRFIG